MKSMSYICPYCKRNVFINIGIHLMEHPCKEYIQSIENKSSNSDYAKCQIEAEIKRLEENPEGDYTTRISALEWALRIIAER